MKRRYYGVRFYGGNRTCTTGQPHPLTGRMSIACGVEVFRTREDLQDWLDNEKLSTPSGCGGGERVSATKAQCRNYRLGLSIDEFLDELYYAELSRYDD